MPWTRLVGAISGGLAVAVGLVVLGGWAFHSTLLVQIAPDLAPMQRNTAMCFVLIGLALLGLVADRPGRSVFLSTTFFSAISAIFAGGSLLEYLVGADFGIDQLLGIAYV